VKHSYFKNTNTNKNSECFKSTVRAKGDNSAMQSMRIGGARALRRGAPLQLVGKEIFK